MTLIQKLNQIRRNAIVKYFPFLIKVPLVECDNCGLCCGSGKCKYLDDNKLCTVYNDRKNIAGCFPEFPIDRWDRDISLGEKSKDCSVSFKGE